MLTAHSVGLGCSLAQSVTVVFKLLRHSNENTYAHIKNS
jgi:hypothetical protein